MPDVYSEMRALVKAKKYDEARTLLRNSTHPQAKTWLAQLEAGLARQQSTAAPTTAPAETKRRLPSLRKLTTILAVVVAVGLGLYFLWDNLVPHAFQDDAVVVTYPPNWKVVAPGRVPECNTQPESRRCLISLVRAPDYFTKIIVIEETLTKPVTLEDYDALFWARVSSTANTILQDKQNVTLDGEPAILRRYTFSFDKGSGSEASLSMIRGQTAYQVFANAEDPQVLLDDLDEVQQILDTLHFKTPDAAPAN